MINEWASLVLMVYTIYFSDGNAQNRVETRDLFILFS